MPSCLKIAAFCLLVNLFNPTIYGQDRKLIEVGKSASCMIELPSKKGYATAFCIHANGLFLTNQHAVDRKKIGDTVNLIMNLGSDKQVVLPAKIIRQDAKVDLALLKCEGSRSEFAYLKLAQIPSSFENLNVTAFGFPYDGGTVSESVGKVTSVRRERKGPHLLRLDLFLNCGNSGGPVLNDSGELVGVVNFGLPQTTVSFAISIETVTQFLTTPDVAANVPLVNASSLTLPKEVEVLLTPFTGELPEATVEFWLYKGNDEPKRFDLVKKSTNRYSGVVLGTTQADLYGKFKFKSGSIEATIKNEKIKWDGQEVSVSDLSSIDVNQESGGDAEVTFANGQKKKIPVNELPTLRIDLGNYPASVNLAKASHFEVVKTAVDASMSYVIIVKNAGKEIYRSNSTKAMEITSKKAVEDVSKAVASANNDVAVESSPRVRKPTPLPDGAVTIPMPGKITDVAQAHAGDYLLITLGTEKKLVIIDIAKATIAETLPLSTDEVSVTGTNDHLVVLDHSRNLLERYSLNGFKRETAIKPPFSGVIKSITAGSATQGPLLVHKAEGTDVLSKASFIAVDLKTFQELPRNGQFSARFTVMRDMVSVRASSNGRIFGMWATNQSPEGIQVLALMGKQMVAVYEHESAGYVVPSVDGAHLFTASRGVYTAGLKKLTMKDPKSVEAPCVPTSHPRFYLSVPDGQSGQFKGRKPGIHELGSKTALLDLPELGLGRASGDEGRSARQGLSLDQRIYLNMAQNRLITVPFANSSVILQEYDFNKELKESGKDYFFVSSKPNRMFALGKLYTYQIAGETNASHVKYEIASGPEKMEITPTGKVTWNVPPDFKNESVDLIISLSNGEAMQTYDSFTIYRDSR